MLAAATACTAQPLRRDYVETGKLDPADEEAILRLVARIGITQVSEIATYYVHPTSYVAITVKEAELTENGTVRFRSVSISKEGWWESQIAKERKQRESEGLFSISYVIQNELSIFRIGSTTYRIRLGPGIERSTVDRILSRIDAKRVRFQLSTNGDLENYFDLDHLRGISVSTEGTFALSLQFVISDYWWFFATVRIDGPELVVFDTAEMQS